MGRRVNGAQQQVTQAWNMQQDGQIPGPEVPPDYNPADGVCGCGWEREPVRPVSVGEYLLHGEKRFRGQRTGRERGDSCT